MEKFLTNCIKARPRPGNVFNATQGESSIDIYLNDFPQATVDQELARLAAGGMSLQAERNQFVAALMEPILQMVPYETLYDRFFMTVGIEQGEDNIVPVEDNLVSISWASAPQTGVFYVRPLYKFYRPLFTTWTSGLEMPWDLMKKAGWNVLARNMNYAVWDLARKRDAVAKAVIDAIIPVSHSSSVSTTLTKAAVDAVLIASNKTGFPVKQALINPGILMAMQSWTWGGTGFFLSPEKSNELLDNLYVSQYGNIKWFASPYVPTDTVYFATDATQVGWHQVKGTPRNDSAVDITTGVDKYTIREAEHAYYAQTGIGLWKLTIS
jgi:hypothetical protein